MNERWAVAGAGLGLLSGLIAFAPAAWLAAAVASGTSAQVQLADPRGTVWRGNAQLVLAGGQGSQDALALPDRLEWQLAPTFDGLLLRLEAVCCIPRPMELTLKPAWRGFELLVKREPVNSRLSGFASLSLARAQRRNEITGETFPFDYDQPVRLNLVSQYKLNDRWSFGVKWSYHSGSPTTPIIGAGTYPDGRARPLYGAINSERVPAYHRLDLRADVKFTKNFTGYFELINAYNRKNVAGYSYSADYSSREAVYQLPLLPSVGLTYSF